VPGGWYYNDVSAFAIHIDCWNMEVPPGDASDDERVEASKNCTGRLIPRVFKAQEDDVKIRISQRVYFCDSIWVLYMVIIDVGVESRFSNITFKLDDTYHRSCRRASLRGLAAYHTMCDSDEARDAWLPVQS
jgi:hypothetical protein